MKSDIFIHSGRKIKRKTLLRIEKAKRSLKQSKKYFLSCIETVFYYSNEISVQYKVFKVSSKNINRF